MTSLDFAVLGKYFWRYTAHRHSPLTVQCGIIIQGKQKDFAGSVITLTRLAEQRAGLKIKCIHTKIEEDSVFVSVI